MPADSPVTQSFEAGNCADRSASFRLFRLPDMPMISIRPGAAAVRSPPGRTESVQRASAGFQRLIPLSESNVPASGSVSAWPSANT